MYILIVLIGAKYSGLAWILPQSLSLVQQARLPQSRVNPGKSGVDPIIYKQTNINRLDVVLPIMDLNRPRCLDI